ncbi:hypothetical protein DL546_009666 [Coniochaeta pulveracea]|uniref:Uncharacterized protein n=1 Tax=Coniochaeta pulveracea TaxID=177199 RepID=A0A420YPB2_9PEZI|nr:hypothetical protein DL546_009666 [Coniochaeta pulveracea]
MASPLSPTPGISLNTWNFSTPPRYNTYDVDKYTTTTPRYEQGGSYEDHDSIDYDTDEASSSPFMSQVMKDDQENAPPVKLRPISRVMSGAELSPLKLLSQDRPRPPRLSLSSNHEPLDQSMPPPPPRSPRKLSSAEKRFPVRVSNFGASTTSVASTTSNGSAYTSVTTPPDEASQKERQPSPLEEQQRKLSLEDVVRDNAGLKHAIDIFEDDLSVLDGSPAVEDDSHAMDADGETRDEDVDRRHTETVANIANPQHAEEARSPGVDAYADGYEEREAVDASMVSTFSDFSVLPNVTMLAAMRSANASPSKLSSIGSLATPRAPAQPSMRTPRANGPLPNRSAVYESGNTTNLLDFTENLRLGTYQQRQSQSPSRTGGRASPSKNLHTMPAQTPQRNSNNLISLLDFDMPPMPTPRSIPTITPRELESLKSGFLSEISSLKASLSGKEAEVSSLKTAVGDAEGRVGTCMEQLRDLQSKTETLTAEKESWEKRGREMEAVLRQVKEEIVLGRRDREELEARLDEAEKRRDAAELMAQEAESKMAGMRAGKASAEAAAAAGTPIKSPTSAGSNKEVELAVERVARELHALYKSKHETKVAALKKSYENRWEKKVRELEGRIEELSRENEEMRIGRDATMTRVDFAAASRMREELEEQRKADRRRHAELEAEVEKLEAVVRTVRADNEDIRAELERERVEKGELVILAEEMMNMQTMQSFIASDASNAASSGPAVSNRPSSSSSGSRPSSSNSNPNTHTFRTSIRPGQSIPSTTPGPASRTVATPSKGLAGRVPASPSGGELGWKSSHGPGIARPTGLRAPGTASRIGKGPEVGWAAREG